jgi:hypothetical protein
MRDSVLRTRPVWLLGPLTRIVRGSVDNLTLFKLTWVDRVLYALDNGGMSTDVKTSPGADPQALADLDALIHHHLEGTPVDPELARRVDERADRITEELLRKGVRIDIEKLLDDAREEQ